MVQETPRAARYRQRADAMDLAVKNLSDQDRATALRHQEALRHLADMEDWVSAEPHVAANYDYKLEPKIDVRPRGPLRANAAGRRVDRAHAAIQGEQPDSAGATPSRPVPPRR